MHLCDYCEKLSLGGLDLVPDCHTMHYQQCVCCMIRSAKSFVKKVPMLVSVSVLYVL